MFGEKMQKQWIAHFLWHDEYVNWVRGSIADRKSIYSLISHVTSKLDKILKNQTTNPFNSYKIGNIYSSEFHTFDEIEHNNIFDLLFFSHKVDGIIG